MGYLHQKFIRHPIGLILWSRYWSLLKKKIPLISNYLSKIEIECSRKWKRETIYKFRVPVKPKSTYLLSIGWQGMSKCLSILYNGKWLKNIDNNPNITIPIINNLPSSSTPISNALICDKYCCLSQEELICFLIGCPGSLSPLPFSSISSLGAIKPNYYSIDA